MFGSSRFILTLALSVLSCKKISVTELRYNLWRNEYGGLRTDQAKRLDAVDVQTSVTALTIIRRLRHLRLSLLHVEPNLDHDTLLNRWNFLIDSRLSTP